VEAQYSDAVDEVMDDADNPAGVLQAELEGGTAPNEVRILAREVFR
jgi:hypothetical protein